MESTTAANKTNTSKFGVMVGVAMLAALFGVPATTSADGQSHTAFRFERSTNEEEQSVSSSLETYLDQPEVPIPEQIERKKRLDAAGDVLKQLGVTSGLAALVSFVGSTYTKSDNARAILGRLSIGLGITSGIINLVGLFVWLE